MAEQIVDATIAAVPPEGADGLAFRLISIERGDPPSGGDGRDWVEYRIAQGVNVIVGHRRGSLPAVTEDVRKVVEGLNERRGVRRGRVDLKTRSPPRAAVRSTSGDQG
jgi:hypothetical protein